MTAILAFDTGTDRCSVALLADGAVRVDEHRTGSGSPAASATLLPAIDTLMREAGIAFADLDAIAFGRGPGAFTGLRTAAAVAQGLALGAGKPVLPVPSLLAVAEEARRARGGDGAFLVWSVLDARMGELYAALHAHDGAAWSTRAEPLLATPDRLVARWENAVAGEPPFAVAGSGVALLGDRLPDGIVRFADAAPRARSVLALAVQAWQRGEGVDAALALPLYVRDKVAETEAERRAAKALA